MQALFKIFFLLAGLAVDFPALRAWVHISAPVGPVDYGPVGPVDYGPVGPVDYGPVGPVD